MNERLSRRVARLLAHRAGFLIFNAFTAAWFAATFLLPETFGIRLLPVFVISLAGYLDVVTWMGGATQFTLAFQNAETLRRQEHADARDREIILALRESLMNQQDVLAALIELAERDINLGSGLREAVAVLDDEIEKLAAATNGSRIVQKQNAALIRKLLARTETIASAAIERGAKLLEQE